MFWYSNLFPNIFLSAGDMSKMTNSKLAKMKNNVTFQNTFARLLTDGLNRYRFEGLPDTISERVLLQSLIWYGSVIIYEKNGNLIALPGIPDGSAITVYGDFGGGWVYGCNGYNENVKLYIPGGDDSSFLRKSVSGIPVTAMSQGVLVRENSIMYPFIRQVIQYAEYISDSMRTLDVCRQHLKHPYLVFSEESTINTVREWFKKISNNEDVIVNTGIFDPSKVNVQNLDVTPDIVNNITSLIEWYENKYKGLCGIEHNAQSDKKGENLLTDEISVDNESDENNVDKCLKYIQQGLDDVNKIFGTNITVEANESESEDDYDDDLSGISDEEPEPSNGDSGRNGPSSDS